VARLFKVAGNRAEQVAASTAIFPGHRAPVVRLAADGARELVNLSWGFVLLQKDRAPRRVTNVRDDKLLTSPFWRDSFATRRCLVPATSFAEPKDEKPPNQWATVPLSMRSTLAGDSGVLCMVWPQISRTARVSAIE